MDLLCVFVGARKRSVPTELFATPAALFQAVELQWITGIPQLAAAARARFVKDCPFFFFCCLLISLILFKGGRKRSRKKERKTHAHVSVGEAARGTTKNSRRVASPVKLKM